MIPAIKELYFPAKDGKQYATLTHATATLADMGEKTITAQVKIDGDIVPDFSQDWIVEFQREKYIMPLRIPQGAKGNESLNSEFDLTFQHWAIYQLKRWPFVTIQQIDAGTYMADEEVASVQLNLKDFCDLFGQVLEYYYGGTITISLNPAWLYDAEPILVEISHTTVWNVLTETLHGKYGVRWAIEAAEGNNNTDKGGERYVIRVGYETTEVTHILEYGFEGGLLKIERQVQSEEIRNLLKGRGGEKNIPRYYFKKSPDEEQWRSDPDWVEELTDIYFPNLMGATFRSYVQGWKAAHISKYPGYTAVGQSNAYAPWAYRKGFTDTKFRPVEFVADEITVSPGTGDRQVEILPGYAPYVKQGSSLDRYGPLSGTLDNNEEIYPTIQGTGMDIAVDVEQVTSDDVEGAAESDAMVSNVPQCHPVAYAVAHNTTQKVSKRSEGTFTVPPGMTGNLMVTTSVLKCVDRDSREVDAAGNAEIVPGSVSYYVYKPDGGGKRSASGIPAGTWIYEIIATVYNLSSDKTLTITIGDESPHLSVATLDADKWKNTFDIWVKNIWNTTKLASETNAQYAERVWKPILGDREQNTAKVLFTTGALAHEDYEFTIVDFPVPDSTRAYKDKNGEAHISHWRITLAKSEAELEATGLYVPSTKKQGAGGDRFVFIGTEMTHDYVVWNEIALDDWKKDQLGEVKEIKPTFVVTTDRVRLSNEGKPGAIIDQLRAGNSIRLADKRFVQPLGDRAYETLYLQSITYTYREPTSEDAALNPDVEIVLGEEYTTSANPVSIMQGDISALQRLVGSVSNIEQIVRFVGDRLYLRKDGIPDRSLSPTQFFSLLTSGDFRAGVVGGTGWGFYQDENGNWVLEADRVNVRQEMLVNNLVINQITARGGTYVESAASMEVVRVSSESGGYKCYFDQKCGTVANLFHVDDVAFCNRLTPENGTLKFYRRRVTEVGADYIVLSTQYVNGSGIPAEGDVIVHYGNYTDKTRRYVKVRDVVGGGYERYIENLDSVNASGTEYYFAGRQASMYNGRPRFYIGDTDGFVEWVNGKLKIKGEIDVQSSIGGKDIGQYVSQLSESNTNLLPKSSRILVKEGTSYYNHTAINLPFVVNKGDVFTVRVTGAVEVLKATSGTTPDTFSIALYGDTLSQQIGGGVKTVGLSGGTVSFTATANSSTPKLIFYSGLWGNAAGNSVAFNKVMMSRGGYAPEHWMPSLYDNDYLMQALGESTTINGGLILTTIMQLGYTAEEGYRIMSGINGMYDAGKPGGGLALWAGGSGVDAADETATGTPATFIIRQDGTGYAARNTIRFRENSLQIGDNVELDRNGLTLFDDDGNIRLQVTNLSVGNDIDLGHTEIPISANGSPTIPVSKRTITTNPSPGSGSAEPTTETVLSINNTVTWTYNIPSSIAKGSTIRIDPFEVRVNTSAITGGYTLTDTFVTARLGYYTGTTRNYLLRNMAQSFTKKSAYLFAAAIDKFQLTTTLDSAMYFIEITVQGYQYSNAISNHNASSAIAIAGKVDVGFESKTILGNDGLLSIWGNTGWLTNKSGVTARSGNAILQISNGSIRVSTDGGVNWRAL